VVITLSGPEAVKMEIVWEVYLIKTVFFAQRNHNDDYW